MNLYDALDLSQKAISQIDDELAKLSYAQINQLIHSIADPVTDAGQLLLGRLEKMKEDIENEELGDSRF